MVISNTAGMGTSTVLTHLSTVITRPTPAKWVVRIDLNDHTDVLNRLKEGQMDNQQAIEFVSERMLKLKPGLETELFKQCCEQKQKVRIVIMLDGFDEISPSYKQTVIGLLQALRQTAVEHLWVTTRPHLRDELEDKLQQLSYTLEPFSEEYQVEFLTTFWSLKNRVTDMDNKMKGKNKRNLENYAKVLIKNLGNSISDKDRQFTGIPLLTRMLAEAFDKEVNTFYDSAESIAQLRFQLDLLGLYERFIERKYDMYQEEKCKGHVNNVGEKGRREREIKIMRENHQLLAMKGLFTEEQTALFGNITESMFATEDLARIGIVQVSQDGNTPFIHHTFAEYYVADCLVNRLTEGKHTSQQVQTFILNDVLMKQQYQTIRAFINGLLSRSKPSKEMLKQYGTRIDELGDDCLLHRAAFEGNANIIEFLLEAAREGGHTDTVRRLLIGQDTRKRTAWHVAAVCGELDVFEKIWGSAIDNLTREEIKSMFILARDIKGNTAWHMAAFWGQLYVLHKIWDLAKDILTREEINSGMLLATDSEGNTAWHLATKGGKLDVLQKQWDLAEEILTPEGIKNRVLLSTNSDGNTAWHLAAKRDTPYLLQKIWDWASENLTTEEIINNLLLATDSEGNTAWHLAGKGCELDVIQKIWDLAQENLTREEIKHKLLLATDSEGNTAWQLAAKSGEPDVLQHIWNLAEHNLTTDEIKHKLLLATDSEGNTAWQLAAKSGEPDALQHIWNLAKHTLTTEEIKHKLLLATDSEGNTAWHLAAKGRNLDVLQKVWHLTKDNVTKEEIKSNLLLARDNEGNTAWNWAARWGELDVLQKLLDLAKDHLTPEEKQTLLVTHSEESTACQLAATRGEQDVL
jgi:ankyrin repeat protein